MTVNNFESTGVTPLSTCRKLTPPIQSCKQLVDGFVKPIKGSTSVCHDWWKIERTYYCTSKTNYNPDLSRAEAIYPTVRQNSSSSWSFSDPVSGAGSISLPMDYSGGECIKACKLLKIEQRAQATPGATTATYRENATSRLYIYRTCTKKDGADVCPHDPKTERVIEDCQCLSEFNEAYGVMSALKQASADQICSDSKP